MSYCSLIIVTGDYNMQMNLINNTRRIQARLGLSRGWGNVCQTMDMSGVYSLCMAGVCCCLCVNWSLEQTQTPHTHALPSDCLPRMPRQSGYSFGYSAFVLAERLRSPFFHNNLEIDRFHLKTRAFTSLIYENHETTQ
jgi:hypothetical protein